MTRFDTLKPKQQCNDAVTATATQQQHDQEAARAAQEWTERNSARYWTQTIQPSRERDGGRER